MGSQSQPPPLPLPTNTRTHALCAPPYPTYQRKSFTTRLLLLAYKSIGVCVRAFKLFQWRPGLLFTRHNLGPGFGCAETVLTPCLTDAVMKGVKVRGRLLRDGMRVLVQPKSCSCSGISVVQSCRKYRNRLL